MNYYWNESKDIEIQEKFKELNFDVANNISLTINIKVKNKSTQIKRSISMFNQKIKQYKMSKI